MATQEEIDAQKKIDDQKELDNAKETNQGNQGGGEEQNISKDDVGEGEADFLDTGTDGAGKGEGAESEAAAEVDEVITDEEAEKNPAAIVPDTDEEIVDESSDEDKAIDSANSAKQYVIIKSKKQGVIFAQPAALDGKRSSGKSIVAQQGYSEVPVDIWEPVRADMLKLGVKEFGRSTSSGKVVTIPFNKFSLHGQNIIAANCNDTKTLNRWKKLPNIDAAIMTVITEKLEKITNYTPTK